MDQQARIADWFGCAAGTFDQAEGIRRFSYFGRRLVAAASLPAGARVLDVATGRGAVLLPAAEQVGAQGHVLGIDLAPGMVAATAQDIARRGLRHVEVRVMDAEHLELPAAAFDAVLCGFGIMFFPHLGRALAEFRRVLRPGGILAVSTWSQPDPRYAWQEELQRAYGIAERLPLGLMINRLNEPTQLAGALDQAGFVDVQVTTDADELVHADEARWWARTWWASPMTRAALETLDAEALERFQTEAFGRLQGARAPGGFPQRVEALFGLGRNP